MRRALLCISVVISIAATAAQDNYSGKFGLPGSDMGQTAGLLLEAIVRGDEAFTREVIESRFSPGFREEFSMHEHLGVFAQMHESLADVEVRGARRTGASSAEFVLESSAGGRTRMLLEIDSDLRITSLGFEPEGADEPAFSATSYEQLDRELAQLAADDRFSGVVMAAPGGQVAFSGAYGQADKRSGVANTEDTRFNIGSLNKGFTGAAVMLLVNDGAVDIDAPISRYLDGFPANVGDVVTVRHLLQHRSGWRHYWDNEHFLANLARLRTMDDYLEFIRQIPLEFEPGTREQYSNTGYEVLGSVIEAASGMSYFDFIEQRIFEPLEMRSTAFVERDEVAPRVAIGYASEHPFLDGAPYSRENTFLLAPKGTAAGGAFSTGADLQRFWLGLVDGDLLPVGQAAMVLRDFEDNARMPDGTLALAGGAPGRRSRRALSQPADARLLDRALQLRHSAGRGSAASPGIDGLLIYRLRQRG